MAEQKRIHAAFVRTRAGGQPVREWLRSLAPDDRRLIGRSIAMVEFGWPIGMPACRPLRQGLYEVRTQLKDRTARVLFLIDGNNMVLLHGFIKKTQATPQSDIDLAKKRQQLWESDR